MSPPCMFDRPARSTGNLAMPNYQWAIDYLAGFSVPLSHRRNVRRSKLAAFAEKLGAALGWLRGKMTVEVRW